MCLYPDDPPIALIGTQTVFALDANNALILTNLEYAKDPTGVDLLIPRQNARYRGGTLARTGAMIRTRSLSRDEVVSINSLLKTTAQQYLAAYNEAWLFPEKAASVAWEDIGRVLLPPSDSLWNFGGEVFIGYKDGTTQYRDAFGRTESAHEFLTKKPGPTEPEPNDPCGCGSGRRYRKCCRNVAKGDRPPWDAHSIRYRNRVFCNAVVDILGLNRGTTWEDVRRKLNEEQVKRIHEVLEMLWPTDTDIANLLPRPDRRVFRAVYMGFIDPRTIAESVIGSLVYFDEIFLLNPFPNPRYMSPEYSPTESPTKHKSQLLKNVRVLFALQPFIDAGIVHLVPDPMEFSPDFRRELFAMAEERTVKWSLKEDETKLGLALGIDDFQRGVSRLPEDQLRSLIRQSQPDIDPKLLESVVEQMKANLVDDPLALLQPVEDGTQGGDLQVFRSMNLELALFVAHLTGAAIYTDHHAHWRQLHEQTSAAAGGQRLGWAGFASKMASLAFPIELNDAIVADLRATGKLCRMRRFFRRCWNAALTPGDAVGHRLAQELAIRLGKASARSEPEWDRCGTAAEPSLQLRRRIELSAPSTGFDLNSVHRLLVTSSRTTYVASIPMALLLTTVGEVEPTSLRTEHRW